MSIRINSIFKDIKSKTNAVFRPKNLNNSWEIVIFKINLICRNGQA